MLVGDVEEGGLVFIDPVVSLHRTTAGTESGFAREVNLFFQKAALALKYGMPKADLALKNFANIGDDGLSDAVGVFLDERFPIAIGAKNIGNRCSGNDFHSPSSQPQISSSAAQARGFLGWAEGPKFLKTKFIECTVNTCYK